MWHIVKVTVRHCIVQQSRVSAVWGKVWSLPLSATPDLISRKAAVNKTVLPAQKYGRAVHSETAWDISRPQISGPRY